MSYAVANCDDRVKELRREIEQDKDKYTPAARRSLPWHIHRVIKKDQKKNMRT